MSAGFFFEPNSSGSSGSAVTPVTFYACGATGVASGSSPILFNFVQNDSANGYSSTIGRYIVQTTGFYGGFGQFYIGSTSTVATANAHLGGTSIAQGSPVTTASQGSPVSFFRNLTAGQILDIRPDTSTNIFAGGTLINRFFLYQIV